MMSLRVVVMDKKKKYHPHYHCKIPRRDGIMSNWCLELRVEQVDWVGLQNVIRAYLNVRHAD
jgi:hypothetical protein